MATPILQPETTQLAQGPPLLTLDQQRIIPGLNGLRIVSWAEKDLAVGELLKHIPAGNRRKAAVQPLLERGLISKLGKRPTAIYRANVRLPALRDGSTVADYLSDPDVTWANMAVMLGVALGAPVDHVEALARAIGMHRDSVRPYMAEARLFHRSLYELKGIEAAVANADGSAQNVSSSGPDRTENVSSSTGPDSGNVSSSQPDRAENVSNSGTLMPATAAVPPLQGVAPPADSSPEHDPPSVPQNDSNPSDPKRRKRHRRRRRRRKAQGQGSQGKPGGTRGRTIDRSNQEPDAAEEDDKPDVDAVLAAHDDPQGLAFAAKVVRGEMLDEADQRRWAYRAHRSDELIALARELSAPQPEAASEGH